MTLADMAFCPCVLQGPPTAIELETLREGIGEWLADPSITGSKSPWGWLASRVSTRGPGWVATVVQKLVADDERARMALSRHFVPAPVIDEDEDEPDAVDDPSHAEVDDAITSLDLISALTAADADDVHALTQTASASHDNLHHAARETARSTVVLIVKEAQAIMNAELDGMLATENILAAPPSTKPHLQRFS